MYTIVVRVIPLKGEGIKRGFLKLLSAGINASFKKISFQTALQMVLKRIKLYQHVFRKLITNKMFKKNA